MSDLVRRASLCTIFHCFLCILSRASLCAIFDGFPCIFSRASLCVILDGFPSIALCWIFDGFMHTETWKLAPRGGWGGFLGPTLAKASQGAFWGHPRVSTTPTSYNSHASAECGLYKGGVNKSGLVTKNIHFGKGDFTWYVCQFRPYPKSTGAMKKHEKSVKSIEGPSLKSDMVKSKMFILLK